MSLITDMVIFAMCEDQAMAKVNQWCAENDDRQQQFVQLDTEAAGGHKVFTSQIWAMAGNYFPHEKLIEAFPSFGWQIPDHVVLIVEYEDDDAARVYRPTEPPPPRYGWPA